MSQPCTPPPGELLREKGSGVLVGAPGPVKPKLCGWGAGLRPHQEAALPAGAYVMPTGGGDGGSGS